ncbi:DUF2594 family protein [Sodalis-like endosymbiont of Proechinophthirus fluctus]
MPASKVIIKMEKYISQPDDSEQQEIFTSTIKKITHDYYQ